MVKQRAMSQFKAVSPVIVDIEVRSQRIPLTIHLYRLTLRQVFPRELEFLPTNHHFENVTYLFKYQDWGLEV
jgi:hypothetical protein